MVLLSRSASPSIPGWADHTLFSFQRATEVQEVCEELPETIYKNTKRNSDEKSVPTTTLLPITLLPIYTLIYDPDASESNRVGAGGIGTPRESPRDGRRNLRETRLLVKRHSIGPRRFFSTRGEIDRFSESRPNIDSGKTSFSDLNQDFARLENPCGIGLALAFQ